MTKLGISVFLLIAVFSCTPKGIDVVYIVKFEGKLTLDDVKKGLGSLDHPYGDQDYLPKICRQSYLKEYDFPFDFCINEGKLFYIMGFRDVKFKSVDEYLNEEISPNSDRAELFKIHREKINKLLAKMKIKVIESSSVLVEGKDLEKMILNGKAADDNL